MTESELLAPFEHAHGEPMTKAELAQATGLTLAYLDTAVRKGLPCQRTGGVRSPLVFDSAQAFAWLKVSRVLADCGPDAARVVRIEEERDFALAEVERLLSRVAEMGSDNVG